MLCYCSSCRSWGASQGRAQLLGTLRVKHLLPAPQTHALSTPQDPSWEDRTPPDPDPAPLCTHPFPWGQGMQVAGVPGELANKGCRWPGWPSSCRAVLSPLWHQLPGTHALPQLQVPGERPPWGRACPSQLRPCTGSLKVWAEAGGRGEGMGRVLPWRLLAVICSSETGHLRDPVPRKPPRPANRPAKCWCKSIPECWCKPSPACWRKPPHHPNAGANLP